MTELIIDLQHVTRTYTLGSSLIYGLNKVTFKVKPGEYVAITGPSGSGKSTLVNVIGGLDTADSGVVRVAGKDLSELDDAELSVYRNQYVGFVFQSFHLQQTATVLENVALPLIFSGVPHEERRRRALACLKAVGLESRLNHKPTQLSNGQQQLTAIARALVTNPKILIADEPTGNLDSARGMEIYEILRKINAMGTTILVVTHDPNMAHLADRVVGMSDGRLAEITG